MVKGLERKSFDGYYYKVDEYGHVYADDAPGDAGSTTDPFEYGGGLYFSLLDLPEDEAWDGGDHIDFDFLILDNGPHVAIHAAIDCDSGSFVEDFDYAVVKREDALQTLESMADAAYQWFYENWPEEMTAGKVSDLGYIRVKQELGERLMAGYDAYMARAYDQDVEGVDY